MKEGQMTSRQQSIYRATHGLCTRCGKPNDREGYSSCSVCAERAMNRYRKRKEERICVDCKKPLVGKIIRCPECNSRRNEWYRKQYWDCINNHVCTKCQKYTVVPGKTKCEVCLAKEANRADRKRRKTSEA